MSLTHEATVKGVGGYAAGDMKIVAYSISFTSQQLVAPSQDPGWFLLNGAAISQTTYPILFARFGTAFNDGTQGAGNFRLPDLTDGKIMIPKGLTNFTTYGASGGEINHTLSSSEMNNHNHGDTFSVSVSGHGHSGSGSVGTPDESHYHLTTYLVAAAVGGSLGGSLADANVGITGGNMDGGTGSHTHGLSASIGNTASPNLGVSGAINATGSGGSHNNMSPYLVLGGWLVKFG